MNKPHDTEEAQHLDGLEAFRVVVAQMLALPDDQRFVSAVDELIFDGRAAAGRVLKAALAQALAGKGSTRDNPLTGLGIEGFYVLVRSCGLEVKSQCATSAAGGTLDEMSVCFTQPNQGNRAPRTPEFVLYNLVPFP